MLWGETAPLPHVRNWSSDFLDASGFTGVGGIEFVESQGRAWFVEFNPRLEAIHFLAKRAGLDTVLLAYTDLAYETFLAHIPEQRQAAAWLGNAWLARVLANPRDLPVAVRDRLAFAKSPRRVTSLWSWRDPGPSIALMQVFISRAAGSLSRHRFPGTSQVTPG